MLQHIPNSMKYRAQILHQELVDTYGTMVKDIERKLHSGLKTKNCLAKTMLEVRDEQELDDLDMAILASAFLIGGVETVSTALRITLEKTLDFSIDSSYHAMVLSPDTSIS